MLDYVFFSIYYTGYIVIDSYNDWERTSHICESFAWAYHCAVREDMPGVVSTPELVKSNLDKYGFGVATIRPGKDLGIVEKYPGAFNCYLSEHKQIGSAVFVYINNSEMFEPDNYSADVLETLREMKLWNNAP